MERKHQLTFYPDPILRQKGEKIGTVTPEIAKFIEEMKEVCQEKKGLGIAAPQVNEAVQLFVTPVIGTHISSKEPLFAKTLAEWTVVINPRIIESSKEFIGYEEGCLSLPKIYGLVFRPKALVVEYEDQNLVTQRKQLTHWFARLFLHEYDHLQGVLFTDYLIGDQTYGIEQQISFDERVEISKALAEFAQRG